MSSTRNTKTVPAMALRPLAQAVAWTVVAGMSAGAMAADLRLSDLQPVVVGAAAAPTEGAKPFYREVNGKSVYIVRLASPAVAAYRGGITGLRATSPEVTGATRLDTRTTASRAYANHLRTEQSRFMATAARTVGRALRARFNYRYALNGVAVELTAEEAKRLGRLSSVRSIERERYEVPLTDDGPIWIGAPTIWEGTPGSRGEGAVIAVLDSGINNDHPSFAAVGGDGYVHVNPLGSGNYLPGSYCDTTDASFCNDKLIGAYSFVPEDINWPSPNDGDGHGSHTASTAGGNVLPDALLVAPTDSITREITGVAPHANIIAYDVCSDGPPFDGGCPSSALLAALDQVIVDAGNLPDGVHSLNYSISGGDNPYSDAIELAFLNVNAAGVYPSASGGNSGSAPATTGHNSPWVGTTAASTHRRALIGTVLDLDSDGGGLPDLVGATFSAGYGPAPIVYAGDFPIAGGGSLETEPEQCLDPFPPGTFSGEIVVCDRGSIARVDKGAHVLAGGAGGYVLANTDAQGEDIVADGHFLPAVHIGDIAGDQLRGWLATNDNTVATLSGTEVEIADENADVVAGFSSRGPNSSIEIIKPDVTAPGVSIMAAIADGATAPPEFGFLSGTSMSSPHHAGSAALLRVLTDWTPSEIKSAIMMTAVKPEFQLKEDGVTTADVFDVGAGRIDLQRVLDAGLVMDESIENYENADPGLGGDPKTLNIASMANHACVESCSWTRTFRNVTGKSDAWSLSIPDAGGVTFTVEPSVLDLADGEEGSITVTANTTLADSGFVFSELNLEPSDASLPPLHLPIAVQAVTSSDPQLLNKSVDLAEAGPGDVLSYEITATNGPLGDEVQIVDEIPAGVSYVDGTALATIEGGSETSPVEVVGNTLSWSGLLDTGGVDVVDNGPISNYVSLASLGVEPFDLPTNPDDGGWIIGVDPFVFNGETYDEVIWSVNGTVEAGTSSGLAASPSNLQLPDPTAPNNLLAGLWTDLNLTSSGNWYVASLFDGVSDYTVFEWEDVPLFGDESRTYTFQIWIQAGSDTIWFAYGGLSDTGIDMTVGAEDATGTSGASYYFDGAGTPPAAGTDISVVSTQGGSVTISFQGAVDSCDSEAIVNEAQLSSGDVAESAIAVTSCSDEPSLPGDINGDGVVDQADVDLVLAARNTPASGPGDPRDMNGDGMIDIVDARLVVLECDLAGCAPPVP